MLAGSKFWSCFNSNLVRLKVEGEVGERASEEEFQFQSGAIKRQSVAGGFFERMAFQFQSGAIKS